MHHVTPNAYLNLSKFVWAVESYGGQPKIDTVVEHYELQKTPKYAGEFQIQFGACSFMAKRSQKERLELSWCQKAKWEPAN